MKDKHERELACLREKYILDQIFLKRTGYEEEIKENKRDVAKKMLKKNIDIDVIKEITDLTVEENESSKKDIW